MSAITEYSALGFPDLLDLILSSFSKESQSSFVLYNPFCKYLIFIALHGTSSYIVKLCLFVFDILGFLVVIFSK